METLISIYSSNTSVGQNSSSWLHRKSGIISSRKTTLVLHCHHRAEFYPIKLSDIVKKKVCLEPLPCLKCVILKADLRRESVSLVGLSLFSFINWISFFLAPFPTLFVIRSQKLPYSPIHRYTLSLGFAVLNHPHLPRTRQVLPLLRLR